MEISYSAVHPTVYEHGSLKENMNHETSNLQTRDRRTGAPKIVPTIVIAYPKKSKIINLQCNRSTQICNRISAFPHLPPLPCVNKAKFSIIQKSPNQYSTTHIENLYTLDNHTDHLYPMLLPHIKHLYTLNNKHSLLSTDCARSSRHAFQSTEKLHQVYHAHSTIYI